jgi:hypothetical protein
MISEQFLQFAPEVAMFRAVFHPFSLVDGDSHNGVWVAE